MTWSLLVKYFQPAAVYYVVIYCACAAVYLSVSAVCQTQFLNDGIYPAVLICGGVMLRVETQVGAEQKVLSDRQSAHQDIILGTKDQCGHTRQ